MFISITPLEEGIVILAIGMGIVFLSLLLLFLVFQYAVPFIISGLIKPKKNPLSAANMEKDVNAGSGEEMAAICTAIYVFLDEAHDTENAIITISKSEKVYSPWSSKIYATHNVRHQ